MVYASRVRKFKEGKGIEIREFAPELLVIMVTAYASDKDVLEVGKLGVSSIFPKGADFSVAARMINEVLH